MKKPEISEKKTLALDLTRSFIDYAQNSILFSFKSLILVNGSACIILGSFLSGVWGQKLQPINFIAPLFYFGMGMILPLLGSLITSILFLHFIRAFSKISNHLETVTEKELEREDQKTTILITGILILLFLSIISFSAGIWNVKQALLKTSNKPEIISENYK